MADIKISQLGAAATISDSDVFPMTANGTTVKAAASLIKEYAIGDDDISALGDGSPTGAILALNANKSAKSDIAMIEASVATAAHAIGSEFYLSGVLMKATAAIAVGDQIVNGTNCAPADDVSSQIQALTNKTFTAYISATQNITIDQLKTDLLNNWPSGYHYSYKFIYDYGWSFIECAKDIIAQGWITAHIRGEQDRSIWVGYDGSAWYDKSLSAKVGVTVALNTTAQNCSEAINELNTALGTVLTNDILYNGDSTSSDPLALANAYTDYKAIIIRYRANNIRMDMLIPTNRISSAQVFARSIDVPNGSGLVTNTIFESFRAYCGVSFPDTTHFVQSIAYTDVNLVLFVAAIYGIKGK